MPAQTSILALQLDEVALQQDEEGRSRAYYSDASTSCYSYSTGTEEESTISLTAAHSTVLQFLLGEEDAKEVKHLSLEDYEGEHYVEELENESLLSELMEDLSFDSDDEEEYGTEEYGTFSKINHEEYGCCGLVYFACDAEQKLEEPIWYQVTCGKLCAGDTAVDDDEATAEETVDETDEERSIETVQDLATLEDITVVETLQDVTVVETLEDVTLVETQLEGTVVAALEEVPVELIEERAAEPGGLILSDANEENELSNRGDPKGIKSAHDDDEAYVDKGESVVARLSMESIFMEPDGTKLAVGNQKIEVKDQTNGINDDIEVVYLENIPGDIGHENVSVTSSKWSQWALQEEDEILERTFWEASVEPSGVKFAENCAYNMAGSKVTSQEGTPANLQKQLESLPQMNAATLSYYDESVASKNVDQETEENKEKVTEVGAKEEQVSECRQRSDSISSEAWSLD
jgi:hypothetical protein